MHMVLIENTILQITGTNVLVATTKSTKRLTITVLTMFATPADMAKLYRTLTI